MRINLRNASETVNSVMPRKFQEGGAMPGPEAGMEGGAPTPDGAPAEGGPQGGGDPMEMLMQLAQMAMQALQGQDAEMAMQVCDGLVQFVQQVQGGGAQGEAPAEPQSEPVYKKGGRLCKRVKKSQEGDMLTQSEECGGKMKKKKC